MVKFEPPECSSGTNMVACGGSDYNEYLDLELAKEKAFEAKARALVAKERIFAACSNPFDRTPRDEGASDQRDDAPQKSAIDEYSASCGLGLESMTFDSILQYFKKLQQKVPEGNWRDLGLFADDGDTKVYNQEEVKMLTESQKGREEHTDKREAVEENKTEEQRTNTTASNSNLKKMEEGQTKESAAKESAAGTDTQAVKKEVTAEEGAADYLKERLAKYLDDQMKSGKHKKRSKKQKKADLKKHLKKSLKAYLKENPKAENKKNKKDLHSTMEQMVSDAVDEHQETKKSKKNDRKKDKKEKKKEEKEKRKEDNEKKATQEKVQEAVSETISAITQTPEVDSEEARSNIEPRIQEKEQEKTEQLKTSENISIERSTDRNLDPTDQKCGDIGEIVASPLKISVSAQAAYFAEPGLRKGEDTNKTVISIQGDQKEIPVETKEATVSANIPSATSSESQLKCKKPLESSKSLLEGFVASESARLHALEQSFSLEQGDEPRGSDADYKMILTEEPSASVKDDVPSEPEQQSRNIVDRLIRYRQEAKEREEAREQLLRDSPETHFKAPSVPSPEPKPEPRLTLENQLPTPPPKSGTGKAASNASVASHTSIKNTLPSDVHKMSQQEVDAAIAEELARLQDLQDQFLRKVNMASTAEPSHEIDGKSSSMVASPAKQTKEVNQVQEAVLSVEEEMAQLRELQASIFEQGRKLTRRNYDE